MLFVPRLSIDRIFVLRYRLVVLGSTLQRLSHVANRQESAENQWSCADERREEIRASLKESAATEKRRVALGGMSKHTADDRSA